MSESATKLGVIASGSCHIKGGFMHFLSDIKIRSFEDALGLAFEIQAEFRYGSVLLLLDNTGVARSVSVFDQPDHSPLDAIEHLESEQLKTDQTTLLITVSNKDCDSLCDVDLELFSWLGRVCKTKSNLLVDWIEVSGDQYRSWASTITPNQAWALG